MGRPRTPLRRGDVHARRRDVAASCTGARKTRSRQLRPRAYVCLAQTAPTPGCAQRTPERSSQRPPPWIRPRKTEKRRHRTEYRIRLRRHAVRSRPDTAGPLPATSQPTHPRPASAVTARHARSQSPHGPSGTRAASTAGNCGGSTGSDSEPRSGHATQTWVSRLASSSGSRPVRTRDGCSSANCATKKCSVPTYRFPFHRTSRSTGTDRSRTAAGSSPVSSTSSRRAATSGVSPSSIPPPGGSQSHVPSNGSRQRRSSRR